jgi:phospholipase C
MDNRRDFIKKAALLSGGFGMAGVLPDSVRRALALDPAPGSTYMDAEHIVILMQENRSFDHCYGNLRGVRGYNDPRAIVQPDKNLVWLQKNTAGETYAPFRLNIKETNATWLGSLPHSWTNQVDARNAGKHDKWLEAKPSGHKGFAKVPLTMGYYNREDIPFYYSLADAFTVCDQNFCSSLTGTTPNRLYLWTGTVRPKPAADSFAHLRNEDVDHFIPANWPTFPEKLEDNNISWKIYQNEISLASGLEGEEDAWLSNFTDNPIEFFSQYNVQHAPSYRKHIANLIATLPASIDVLKEKLKGMDPADAATKKLQEELIDKETWLSRAKEGIDKYTAANFEKLSQREKNLHEKAFSINKNDPHYRELDTLHYEDGNMQREMKVPKGDVLQQFRQDVDNNVLPTVSWIVGPENFSDHPGAPWYGAWYVSEVMDILTNKPEVWKKTIFILCYDENDGYYDHVPPFAAPNPADKNSGKVSEGIDAGVEFVTLEQDMKKYDQKHARENSIGLGYRVPLVIASPWSRGGVVCSQVFDHTSIIQFIEKFVNQKFNKNIEETNISRWRRAVCGDLSSVFSPYNEEKPNKLLPATKEQFIESIHNAKFKKDPFGYKPLSAAEIKNINERQNADGIMPVQEKGMKPACAIPYELYAGGQFIPTDKIFKIKMAAGNENFGLDAAGAAFQSYAHFENDMQTRSYAVAAGKALEDEWTIDKFPGAVYHFSLHGPNGFFREFKGGAADPAIAIDLAYEKSKPGQKKLTGNIIVTGKQAKSNNVVITITDNAYRMGMHSLMVKGQAPGSITLDLSKSFGWYDFTVRVAGYPNFGQRFAGHVETGQQSFTDPFMGGVV